MIEFNTDFFIFLSIAGGILSHAMIIRYFQFTSDIRKIRNELKGSVLWVNNEGAVSYIPSYNMVDDAV